MAGRRRSVDYQTVKNWLNYAMQRRSEGVSSWRIAGEIKHQWNQAPSRLTIYHYLNPSARETASARAKITQKQRRLKLSKRQAKIDRRTRLARERRRRNIAERPEYARRYARNYARLTRPNSQKQLLDQLFHERPAQWLEEIAAALPAFVEGICFASSTIEQSLLYRVQTMQVNGEIPAPPYLREAAPRLWIYVGLGTQQVN